MAHNLVFNSMTGKTEFMSRGAAWHNLGQVVSDAQTWQDTVKLAGLAWEVEKRQLQSPDGIPVDAYGIFRADNSAFLGAVGARYQPIQNEYQFAFVDSLLEADGAAHYESAGALGKGEQVFCLANIGKPFEIAGGDRHENYLLFVNNHDGREAARVMLTSVRVVCANTLRQALRNSADSNVLKIRHTSGAAAKLDAARALIQSARLTTETLQEKLHTLSRRMMTQKTFKTVVDNVFGEVNHENQKSSVWELFESNDNNAFPEVKDTAYNLLNAITEHYDFWANVRNSQKRQMDADEIRAKNALFGATAEQKESALDMILSVTHNAPVKPQPVRVDYGAGANAAMIQSKTVAVIELDAPPPTTPNGGAGAGLLDDILSVGVRV